MNPTNDNMEPLPLNLPPEASGIDLSSYPEPQRHEMDELFKFCRDNEWNKIHEKLAQNPKFGITPMTMENHITTTLLHQAFTGRKYHEERGKVVERILQNTPQASRIKNGYHSLPIHALCQRNVNIRAKTKARWMAKLAEAFPESLQEPGGTGKRTPLHVVFTDYLDGNLVRRMIQLGGAAACSKFDKKGYLPAHVACSRHVSPDKLNMLLTVYPAALYERTKNGKTLLDLATETATDSHPNFALIDDLNRRLQASRPESVVDMATERISLGSYSPSRAYPPMHHHHQQQQHPRSYGMMPPVAVPAPPQALYPHQAVAGPYLHHGAPPPPHGMYYPLYASASARHHHRHYHHAPRFMQPHAIGSPAISDESSMDGGGTNYYAGGNRHGSRLGSGDDMFLDPDNSNSNNCHGTMNFVTPRKKRKKANTASTWFRTSKKAKNEPQPQQKESILDETFERTGAPLSLLLLSKDKGSFPLARVSVPEDEEGPPGFVAAATAVTKEAASRGATLATPGLIRWKNDHGNDDDDDAIDTAALLATIKQDNNDDEDHEPIELVGV